MHDVFNLKNTPSNDNIKEDKEKRPDEESVDSQFETSRQEWLQTVKSMSEKIRSINQLADVQVELYSNRQVALEHNHYLIGLFSKMNSKYNQKRKERYEHYYKNSDIRYNKGEIEEFVNGDTATIKQKVDMFSAQIEYFKDTIKTIDNMIFGVKTRLEIEKFKNGIS